MTSPPGNYQRLGSSSNTHVGRDFELQALAVLSAAGIAGLKPGFTVEIGLGRGRRPRRFDLGTFDPPVLVECKSHRWTTGGNVPSAKVTVWNEAMLFFYAAPQTYRKIFFVLRDYDPRRSETLAEYYVRTHSHMIPAGVEIWEYDDKLKTARSLSIEK
jgi:hypothetical protein